MSALSHMPQIDVASEALILAEIARIKEGVKPKAKKGCRGCGKSKRRLRKAKEAKEAQELLEASEATEVKENTDGTDKQSTSTDTGVAQTPTE